MFGKLKSLLRGNDAKNTPEPAVQTHSPREKALLEGELRAAKRIQEGLVPKTFPPIPGCLPFDLYALLEPAQEIGGDFYDFWMNGREHLTLVIGDVSGKGIPAALFMAVCRTYLRAFSRSEREPAKLLEVLNNELSRHNESCMFVTIGCAVVHIPTGKVEYANAGHNPPILRKQDGEISVFPVAEDTPIGFMNGVKYNTRWLQLEPGDSLLFYTDGVTEAFNSQNEMLGEERAMALFKNASASNKCQTTIELLRAGVDEFTGDARQSDDITLMMYGQRKQTGVLDTDETGDLSDCLSGETSVFSLSDLHYSLPRTKTGKANCELGKSLSEF